MSFYTLEELNQLGLKSFGDNVLISRYSRLYNCKNISIGNNVRIDDFSILSCGENPFIIEDNIHISAGVYIYGQGGFYIKSYSNISGGVKIYTISDTFDGNYLIGPMVPIKYRNIKSLSLVIEKHVIIGTGTIILPINKIGEGVAIGANSLVLKDCDEWNIYVGSPAKLLKKRSRKILELEKQLFE